MYFLPHFCVDDGEPGIVAVGYFLLPDDPVIVDELDQDGLPKWRNFLAFRVMKRLNDVRRQFVAGVDT